MATISEALVIGLQHHQAGRFDAAERIYRDILAVQPDHVDALHLRGVLATQTGRPQEAIEYINRSLKLKPDHPEAHNNLGNALKDQKRLDEAVACYQRALKMRPNYVEALNNLGSAFDGLAKLDDAVACYQRALELKPDFAQTHCNLGNAFRGLGRLDEAVACYRRALEMKPNLAQAHYNLGNTVRDQGQLEEAVACYRRAIEQKPDYLMALNNLGNVFSDLKQYDAAIDCFLQAITLKPDYAEGHNNLGNVFRLQGEFQHAIDCFQRALAARPDYVEAFSSLGTVYCDQGNWDRAVDCFRQALALKPDFAEVHYNLGNAWQSQSKLDEAVACYRRTLELKPELADAHNSLGVVLTQQDKLEEAIACYNHALELNPNYAEAYNNLGHAYKSQGKLDETIACYQRSLTIQPESAGVLGALVNQLQHVCRWDGLNELSQRVAAEVDRGQVEALASLVTPFFFLALPTTTTALQQLRCASQWADWKCSALTASAKQLTKPPQRAADRAKIVVGYLSADFHAHATAWLIVELFEKHDRERFVIHGYSLGPDDGSPIRRRLVGAFDRFVDLSEVSHIEAAQRIADDGVDILVDLKGYTTNARTEILAYRPAPIQVNYLGFPATMGTPLLDYILVDDFIVPPDQQPYFTEKLVHLPGCYQINDSQREISPITPSRTECGLPETGFVFCCFNNSYKITEEMFAVWMRLLVAVPGSVLWLLEGNRFAPEHLRREATARGVSADRLVFAPRMPLAEHLARHRQADLFLDTVPVNAHTTASDALWAGCPVLTIAGQTFVSRVAGSLLRSLGLPELVTTSLDEYEALALRLARDADWLDTIRSRLQSARDSSPLFDAARFARNLERAYETMWSSHTAGDAPHSFAVPSASP